LAIEPNARTETEQAFVAARSEYPTAEQREVSGISEPKEAKAAK
jgi:hypothetical protein